MTKTEMGAVQPPVKKSKRGPGRPPKSKTQRIRDMVAAGASVKHITEKLGVSPQQVYQVRYDLRKQELVSKKWADPQPLPMPAEDKSTAQPWWALPVVTPPKPTFWQRVKAVFFPN